MKRKARVLMAFGEALRKFRLDAGLSQEELAARADLHRTYVGDVERGERNVSLVNMVKLSEASGVKLSRVLKEAEKEL
ncbi:helix-turn-helix transcriptional regulator [Candidatus Nitronereus thalassa]|uniref:Helix-turn-helix transcriptional regulator n=1 Tax=Candidatus Nitronereus thalassa TaxID=3020898 RepID=A0ABU3KB58_9BACT|nr:helix-turn-helix transcriptional regulator [Candidatus Nitronereus thalassa]MDT7043671.1 helix-turn-helix transcriptional regulator [Candidatus Nitronereus thalassa]